VGCSLASGLVDLIKKIKRNVDPDLLFIEPSEMVVTRELKDVTAMGLRDIRFGAGPFITLVDGPQFPFLWSDRRALLLGQVKDADLVAVSRMDLIGSRDMETINGLLQSLCGPLIPLSAQNGDGMGEVMKRID
jgi:G3E family GTPase